LSSLLTKGTRVYADGRLETRPWTDRAGNLHAGLEIVADSVEFASSRQDADPTTPTRTVNAPARAGVNYDDDIPF
jgi:single-stranded DNA-binding protein